MRLHNSSSALADFCIKGTHDYVLYMVGGLWLLGRRETFCQSHGQRLCYLLVNFELVRYANKVRLRSCIFCWNCERKTLVMFREWLVLSDKLILMLEKPITNPSNAQGRNQYYSYHDEWHLQSLHLTRLSINLEKGNIECLDHPARHHLAAWHHHLRYGQDQDHSQPAYSDL